MPGSPTNQAEPSVQMFSPDDHIVEPPWLFEEHLPTKYRDDPASPRVRRERGRLIVTGGVFKYLQSEDAPPNDVWVYEGKSFPTSRGGAMAGLSLEDLDNGEDAESRTVTFDTMRPGYFKAADRLSDMDLAGIRVSACFPNQFVRFCGQRFLEASDKDLALACVRAYNDFVVEEWCHNSGGRLLPVCIVPLWDTALAIEELRRNASRGVRGLCFSEIPARLGLPSLHSGQWNEFFRECAESETVIMIHIGSSSQFATTSSDAPQAIQSTAMATNSALAMLDWIYSGIFIDIPSLRVVIAESQIGWIPYFLQRADQVWERHRGYDAKISSPPSNFFRSNISCTFFDDDFGLEAINYVGADNVLFESDYPHGDSNWPNSLEVGKRMTSSLDTSLARKILWDNGAKLFKL